LFCKKGEELGFFQFYLPYTVFDSSHNKRHNCCNSNQPCLTMIFLLL
jgi:hypothetical protein